MILPADSLAQSGTAVFYLLPLTFPRGLVPLRPSRIRTDADPIVKFWFREQPLLTPAALRARLQYWEHWRCRGLFRAQLKTRSYQRGIRVPELSNLPKGGRSSLAGRLTAAPWVALLLTLPPFSPADAILCLPASRLDQTMNRCRVSRGGQGGAGDHAAAWCFRAVFSTTPVRCSSGPEGSLCSRSASRLIGMPISRGS